MTTLLDNLRKFGSGNLKGKFFVDSCFDGAVYKVLTAPRIRNEKFDTTNAKISIHYLGERESVAHSVKRHYDDIERN